MIRSPLCTLPMKAVPLTIVVCIPLIAMSANQALGREAPMSGHQEDARTLDQVTQDGDEDRPERDNNSYVKIILVAVVVLFFLLAFASRILNDGGGGSGGCGGCGG